MEEQISVYNQARFEIDFERDGEGMARQAPRKPGPQPHTPVVPGATKTYAIRRFPVVLLDTLREEGKRRTQIEKRRVPLQEVFQKVIVAGLKALKIEVRQE